MTVHFSPSVGRRNDSRSRPNQRGLFEQSEAAEPGIQRDTPFRAPNPCVSKHLQPEVGLSSPVRPAIGARICSAIRVLAVLGSALWLRLVVVTSGRFDLPRTDSGDGVRGTGDAERGEPNPGSSSN